MPTAGDDHRNQDAQRQYQEIQRLNESITKMLVEIGRMEVRAQERHEVTTRTIRALRQAMDTFISRREIDQRDQITSRRLDELQEEHDRLAIKHEALRQVQQDNVDRQVRITSYAAIAGTGIGSIVTYFLRKFGIIS